ncbi:hypothetical protein SAMN04487943_108164 [Gracilibacillus orientalis]|uniref:Uncharacterized protein n=1 Tax=Gracilibacillus orientalis TaxID=334253 RepID=A0A1I4NEQ6_9BACI|nr:hypothetical protein [Gracilibacillus orientalis]SFM14042.1 hypothetical protein SAMN04487943_108164 [Gracilibacillus orientalis]
MEWVLVEKGVVDWTQVFFDVKAVGYDGIEDFKRSKGTKESIKHNIDTVKHLKGVK